MSRKDRALDVAEHRGAATQSGRQCDVDASSIGEAAEARQAVGDDGRSRHDDALAFEAGYAPDFDPLRPPLGASLDGHDDRLLARAATPALATTALATEIGVIHLDAPRQAIGASNRSSGLRASVKSQDGHHILPQTIFTFSLHHALRLRQADVVDDGQFSARI